jgi:hypothetical protein
MLGANEQRGEVARLLALINVEYESAQHGFSGLSLSIARHYFITVRMASYRVILRLWWVEISTGKYTQTLVG